MVDECPPSTLFNEPFRTIILEVTKILPALKEKALSKVSFKYAEIETTHTSNSTQHINTCSIPLGSIKIVFTPRAKRMYRHDATI